MKFVASATLFFLWAGAVSLADSNVGITSFNGSGVLVWRGSNMTSYSVEWAPAASGPWTNSWNALVNIPENNGYHTSSVPMFYRVVGWQGPASTLLIHGDGTNNATAFQDLSGHAIATYGSAHVTTGESVFGGGSIAISGSGSYLQLAQGTDWAFHTNDFTVDLWVKVNSPATMQLIGCHQAYSHADWCRDSMKMSPCNSLEMSPSQAPCRKAGAADGDVGNEQQGATAHGADGAGG